MPALFERVWPVELENIDQKTYQKRLRLVMLAVVVALCAISIPFSAVLIVLIGSADGGNFILNLAGVAVAAIAVAAVLKRSSGHPWMHEVVYVWRLKQQLNRITRKFKAVNEAAEKGERDALVILNFSYRGSEQLYTLDNNTITLDDLRLKIAALDTQLSELGLDISTDDYREDMLSKY